MDWGRWLMSEDLAPATTAGAVARTRRGPLSIRPMAAEAQNGEWEAGITRMARRGRARAFLAGLLVGLLPAAAMLYGWQNQEPTPTHSHSTMTASAVPVPAAANAAPSTTETPRQTNATAPPSHPKGSAELASTAPDHPTPSNARPSPAAPPASEAAATRQGSLEAAKVQQPSVRSRTKNVRKANLRKARFARSRKARRLKARRSSRARIRRARQKAHERRRASTGNVDPRAVAGQGGIP